MGEFVASPQEMQPGHFSVVQQLPGAEVVRMFSVGVEVNEGRFLAQGQIDSAAKSLALSVVDVDNRVALTGSERQPSHANNLRHAEDFDLSEKPYGHDLKHLSMAAVAIIDTVHVVVARHTTSAA